MTVQFFTVVSRNCANMAWKSKEKIFFSEVLGQHSSCEYLSVINRYHPSLYRYFHTSLRSFCQERSKLIQ